MTCLSRSLSSNLCFTFEQDPLKLEIEECSLCLIYQLNLKAHYLSYSPRLSEFYLLNLIEYNPDYSPSPILISQSDSDLIRSYKSFDSAFVFLSLRPEID